MAKDDILQTNKNIMHYDTIDDAFNQEVLDRLPGVFYLYHIDGEEYKMKRWNKYHLDLYGYSPEECYDKSPFFYIDPAYHQIVANAVLELMEYGVKKQVFVNVVTKHGESIPFTIEGYMLKIGTEDYFMGLGLNVSDLVSVKQQLQILEIETAKILKESRRKEKQLLTLALEGSKNNGVMDVLSKKIELIKDCNSLKEIKNDVKGLSSYIKSQAINRDNWENFKDLFINIHKNFFIKLKKRNPNLTESEIRFCAYMKINMSSDDLCDVLNISKEGLKKKRYRLKIKLDIEKGKSIEAYIFSL